MLVVKYATQPKANQQYCSLVSHALQLADFQRIDVAVAYATTGGVQALVDSFDAATSAGWLALDKRFLVGIDWCRTEPAALSVMSQIPSATVRVHDGAKVARRSGCVPELPFHPKAFILRGRGTVAVISGSGNLSRNGMTKGHELGQMLLVSAAASAQERRTVRHLSGVQTWFEDLWRVATKPNVLMADYEAQYAARMPTPCPTDDDALDDATVSRKLGVKRLAPEDISRLRAASTMWIEAGNLHKNRGPQKPGNQLMMSPMTRVFFGFPPKDVPTDTKIGDVSIRHGSGHMVSYSLRYSNNSMDVLSLPIPGLDGPSSYDQETIVFVKRAIGGALVVEMTLASPAVVRQLKARSDKAGASFRMTSGRRWGVC